MRADLVANEEVLQLSGLRDGLEERVVLLGQKLLACCPPCLRADDIKKVQGETRAHNLARFVHAMVRNFDRVTHAVDRQI